MANFASHTIAMLGVGGAGMRGLAVILATRGARILGVDRDPTSAATALAGAHIPVVAESHGDEVLAQATMVIHTDAVGGDHPLLQQARAKGLPTKIYHEALGELTREMRTIAVTGTHGKSSTTSMLAHIFTAVGRDPVALVGASIPAWGGSNARIGTSDLFIIEADEYRDHFLALEAESAIITTIDFDHPDYFHSLADVTHSFTRFLRSVSTTGVIIVPTAVMERFPEIAWPSTTKAVDPPPLALPLVLPGAHMQYNAWLAIQMARAYSIEEKSAIDALTTYTGLGRRFELLHHLRGMDIVSDYGHHPAEIAATIRAARERYSGQKICIVVEIHTRERLLQFLPAFKEALALADGIIIAPVFVPPGRDQARGDTEEAVTELQASLVAAGREVWRMSTMGEIGPLLEQLPSTYTVALAFSAGTLDGALRSLVNKH